MEIARTRFGEAISAVPFFVFPPLAIDAAASAIAMVNQDTPTSASTMAFTYFFRDSESLALAMDLALPRMLGQSRIRIWDAGCAHGPEPYTLAMLLRERMSEFVFRNVTIHATDVEPSGLFARKVTEGVYREEELRRLPAGFLEKYFRRTDQPGMFQVVEQLRAKVEFTRHDLLSLTPIREGLTMVVCKNVLLHLEERQRVEVLQMFHSALRPEGILVMEHTQKVPEALGAFFQQLVAHARVYQKLERSYAVHGAEVGGAHGRTDRGPGVDEQQAARDCQGRRYVLGFPLSKRREHV